MQQMPNTIRKEQKVVTEKKCFIENKIGRGIHGTTTTEKILKNKSDTRYICIVVGAGGTARTIDVENASSHTTNYSRLNGKHLPNVLRYFLHRFAAVKLIK